MSDRELLELAAQAAGIGEYVGMCADAFQIPDGWNPLADDGEALRLAVKLHIDVFPHDHIEAFTMRDGKRGHEIEKIEMDKGDRYAATRRVIVRVAAEIGRNL